jgi:carbon monoxide dehydrogenase subunit G
LPGIDEVKQIDDKTFDGIISANVGPISGKFKFRSTILESRPPEQMVVRTEGTDTVTKSIMNADMVIDKGAGSVVDCRCTESGVTH